jgi:hypothetical protein
MIRERHPHRAEVGDPETLSLGENLVLGVLLKDDDVRLQAARYETAHPTGFVSARLQPRRAEMFLRPHEAGRRLPDVPEETGDRVCEAVDEETRGHLLTKNLLLYANRMTPARVAQLKTADISKWPQAERERVLVECGIEKSRILEHPEELPEIVLNFVIEVSQANYPVSVVRDPVRWGWGVALEHGNQGVKLLYLENHNLYTEEDGKALLLFCHLVDAHGLKDVPCSCEGEGCARCDGDGHLLHAAWGSCGQTCLAAETRLNRLKR